MDRDTETRNTRGWEEKRDRTRPLVSVQSQNRQEERRRLETMDRDVAAASAAAPNVTVPTRPIR